MALVESLPFVVVPFNFTFLLHRILDGGGWEKFAELKMKAVALVVGDEGGIGGFWSQFHSVLRIGGLG